MSRPDTTKRYDGAARRQIGVKMDDISKHKTLLWIGVVCLLIFYALFAWWLLWEPSAYSTIPAVKGSVCVNGECWIVENGKRVRL